MSQVFEPISAVRPSAAVTRVVSRVFHEAVPPEACVVAFVITLPARVPSPRNAKAAPFVPVAVAAPTAMCSSAFVVLFGLITVRSRTAPSAAVAERNALSGSARVFTTAEPSTPVTVNSTVPFAATRMLLRTVTSMPVRVDT